MASLTPIYLWRSGSGFGLRALLVRVNDGTAADTVTIGELTTVSDVVAISQSDGAAFACTEATNVVTLGAGPADDDILLLITGH